MTETVKTVPFRAALPVPAPDNLVAFPGLLDRPTLMFGDPSVGVAVLSDEALASASLADALARGWLDGLDPAGGARRVALTAGEIAALSRYATVAEAWVAASTAGDRAALVEAVGHIRALGSPDGVDVDFVMPPRRRAA